MTALPCCSIDFYQSPLVRQLLGDSFHPGGTGLTAELAKACLVHRGSSLLDLAAGTGTSARFLRQRFGCQVLALDAASRPEDPFHRLQADAHALPLQAASLDAVLCECALASFTDANQVLRQVQSALKPGGFIGISDMVLAEDISESERQTLDTELAHLLCVAKAPTANEGLAQLKSHGFSQVRYRDVSHELVNMARQIRQRLRYLGDLAQSSDLVWSGHAAPLLNLEQAILDGRVGYGLFIGRWPGIRLDG